MKRAALLLSVIVMVASAGPAAAQSSHATPTSAANYRKIKVPVKSLANPGNRAHNAGTMSGAGCTSGVTANRAQQSVNPINGKAQAAPIVSIPISKGGGSVANGTTRAQQAHACAHTR